MPSPAAAPPGTMAQRLKACAACHGQEGRATNQGFFPRIAGKPAGYLYNQLVNFRDGKRQNATMAYLVDHMSEAYLREIAGYFASLDLPYPPPQTTNASAATLARGEQLVRQGDAVRGVPACSSCHGESMTGVAPSVPGLLGLPRDYILAQFGAWRNGLRRAAAPDCMGESRDALRRRTSPRWRYGCRPNPEAGVQAWSPEEVVRLLKDGQTTKGAAMGSMPEVVFRSTQHLGDADLRAMAAFLRELPQHQAAAPEPVPVPLGVLELGARVYKAQCADCHGERGEGGGSAYPPLAGHRTATMASGANLVKVILSGGFPPTTTGNPRPYGMPPFGQDLTNAEIAAVASFVRDAWGNNAPGVTELDVDRLR